MKISSKKQISTNQISKYDVHVATEGLTPNMDNLMQALEEIGFKDDGITGRPVTYAPEDGWGGMCPIFGVHASKKEYADINEVKDDMNLLKDLIPKFKQDGYAHAEYIDRDVTIKSTNAFHIIRPFPVEKFTGHVYNENKNWDMHIAMPIDTLPSELETIMSEPNSGMYFIELPKIRECKERLFRVYTIQGTSAPQDGQQLFTVLERWYTDVNAPHVEMKMEVTFDMFRIGNPRVVPPTVSEVRYK